MASSSKDNPQKRSRIETRPEVGEVLTKFSDLTEPPATSTVDDAAVPDTGSEGPYNKLFAAATTESGNRASQAFSDPPANPVTTSMHLYKNEDSRLESNSEPTASLSASQADTERTSTSIRSTATLLTGHQNSLRLDPESTSSSTKYSKASLSSPIPRPVPSAPSTGQAAQPTLSTFQATVNYDSQIEPAFEQRTAEEYRAASRDLLSVVDDARARPLMRDADLTSETRSTRRERQLQSSPPPLSIADIVQSKAGLQAPAISGDRRGTSASEDSRSRRSDAREAFGQVSKDDAAIRAAPLSPLPLDDARPYTNPLHLLASHDVSPRNERLETKSKRSTTEGLPSPYFDQARGAGRIDQSKLPGFQASRTSSTDSARTSAVTSSAHAKDLHLDGQRDKARTQALSQTRQTNRLRSRLLGKEYWMKDENARDCFRCGESFTLVRRKHHCRTCGQIFDNKCTKLIAGSHFDMPSAVRVCKACEGNILAQDDDESSEYSDEESNLDAASIHRTHDQPDSQYDDDNVSLVSHPLEHMSKAPAMYFPVRRAPEGGARGSTVFEFEAPDHPLQRPSSSRSLRSAHSLSSGHKRQHSKHAHMRNLRNQEPRVPFQRADPEHDTAQNSSAFHRDSIIDPDLAQYLSDDASSDDEPQLRLSHSTDKISRPVPEHDRSTIGGILAAVRKGRPRIGDRTIANLLNFANSNADDAASIVSARAVDGPRGARRRNHSVASSVHLKNTPRATRERVQLVVPDESSSPIPPSPTRRAGRIMRSASMHGTGAPQLELNRASVQHVHNMLRQMLRDARVSNATRWEQALVPIFLKASDEVDPDIEHGDDIDIRSYVKLKKIPGGRPGDSTYVSGVMFSKNVALKSMQRSIVAPRILLVTFALEYSGASMGAHFQSLDPVIRQEREHLENVVKRIKALEPNLVLVQRNVSRIALELLDRANITVAYNVKTEALEAVHRITQADFVHSLDKLSSPAIQLGTCELFEVKTYLIEGRRKTFLSLSGCPPELGCTIVLRGSSWRTLQKIKKIADDMIYVVYNLKLENCLMRDEWAMIPTGENIARTTSTNSAAKIDIKCADQPLKQKDEEPSTRSFKSVIVGQTTTSHESSAEVVINSKIRARSDSNEMPDDVPGPTLYQDLANKHETRILSASPFVRFSQPYLLTRAREMERRVTHLKRLRDQDVTLTDTPAEKGKSHKFTLITPEMLHNPSDSANPQVREIIRAVHDAEYEKAMQHYEKQKSMWESVLSEGDLFDPSSRQNITVSYGYVKDDGTPCEGPELQAYRFYTNYVSENQMLADMTLGQFVQRLCLRANEPCSVCGKRAQDHQHQYVHGEARVTFFTEPCPPKLRGLEDVILMWSICKICQTETTVATMSPSTWKYSWAKYLELSFWSADLQARTGGCRHDLHRDHLRFFGFRNFAVRVHYEPIELLEVVQPKDRITWKVENDLRYKNDMYTRMEHRIVRFMASVKFRLQYIKMNRVRSEVQEACHKEIDRLIIKANEDLSSIVKKLQELYSTSKHWKITPLNGVLRLLQTCTTEWDAAFLEIESNFFPSERDIRRLATLQLKKIFIDRDVSIVADASEGEHSAQLSEKQNNEDPAVGNQDGASKLSRKISPEKTESVLASVVEGNAAPSPVEERDEGVLAQDFVSIGANSLTTVDSREMSTAPSDLKHLDLAVPGDKINAAASENPSSTLGAEAAIPSQREQIQERKASNPVPNLSDEQAHASYSGMKDRVGELVQPDVNSSASIRTQLQTASLSRPNAESPSSPTLARAHSQPSGSLPQRKDFTIVPQQGIASCIRSADPSTSTLEQQPQMRQEEDMERKFSDSFKISQLRTRKLKGQSLIPRAIATAKRDSRVSNLAKHFEQLTKEFEQARLRERQQRANSVRKPPLHSAHPPKATVHAYTNIREAVGEAHSNDDSAHHDDTEDTTTTVRKLAEVTQGDSAIHKPEEAPLIKDETTPVESEIVQESSPSYEPSESDDKTDLEGNDEVEHMDDTEETTALPDKPEELILLTERDLELDHLQKHERSSLIKMLTNFWAERSSSGWPALDYTVQASEHIFDGSDVIIRDDELSSSIAYALSDPNYVRELQELYARPMVPRAKMSLVSTATRDAPQDDTFRALACDSAIHLKISVEEPMKLSVRVFFAHQFDAMRKKCGIDERFVESMSRCMKYDSKGGKSKSIFLKTLDDRFVLKSLSQSEASSFVTFAPRYFDIMTETFYHTLPTCIAKMVGAYSVTLKNPATNTELTYFLLVMENLLYDRSPERIFDLKGSMRNRRINVTGERNEVLLDENMVDFIYESPLFVREHSSKLVHVSVKNDSLFLSKMNVMDYSLLVAIDEPRRELIVGIIDCIRTYTLDKKLESWIKDRGLISAVMGAGAAAGMGSGVTGGKNKPTITSPRDYRRRFRQAMRMYILEAPSCWHKWDPQRDLPGAHTRVLFPEDDAHQEGQTAS